jgi:hypothetical protein
VNTSQERKSWQLLRMISRLKIQDSKEGALKLLSESENSSIRNIEFPIHTTLIFNEQAKVKDT